MFQGGEFIEIYVDTPLDECERRDVKGLYAKSRRGELKNFTAIDSVYEPPEFPELTLETIGVTPEMCVDRIIHLLMSSAGARARQEDQVLDFPI